MDGFMVPGDAIGVTMQRCGEENDGGVEKRGRDEEEEETDAATYAAAVVPIPSKAVVATTPSSFLGSAME